MRKGSRKEGKSVRRGARKMGTRVPREAGPGDVGTGNFR